MCNIQQFYYVFIVVTCAALLNKLQNKLQINYNQQKRPDGKYPVYTVATYTCNDGYVLSGSDSNTCQTSGDWQQGNPNCNRGIKCHYIL